MTHAYPDSPGGSARPSVGAIPAGDRSPGAAPAEPATSDPVSRRARDIPSFIVMDVLEQAQQMERAGEHIIHLEVGEPDFDTPEPVVRAASEALARGETHYTHSLGIPDLREAIAHEYRRRYGVEVSPDQVVVTSGSSPAILLAFAALLDRGDQVILSNPHYACYPTFVDFCEGEAVYVPVREEERFQFVPEEVGRLLGGGGGGAAAAGDAGAGRGGSARGGGSAGGDARAAGAGAGRVKAVMVNSPANPTGTLMARDELADLLRRVESAGAFTVSDEIYHGLVYEGEEHSALEFSDRVFVVSGFSKLYAMTGWRLGYLIAPPEFVRPIQKIQQNFFISANAFVQRAGIAALTECEPHVRRMLATYDERRRYMLERLEGMGFRFACHPTGAFYVFANVRHLCDDCYDLAFDILREAKVGCTPGIDFGSGGEGYVRFSYANSLENIKEGMDRLQVYVESRAECGGPRRPD